MDRGSDLAVSAGCFAGNVVRAGLDPLTGRTLSFNHVPMAAWAGQLCDLLLAGALIDDHGCAAVGTSHESQLHPVVRSGWVTLEPGLPRPWQLLFGPQTVDINRAARDVREWLVASGMWRARRTLWGMRHTSTGEPPTPTPPAPPGAPEMRNNVQAALIGTAEVNPGSSQVVLAPADAADATGQAIRTVLSVTSELIAQKRGVPLQPGGIGWSPT